MSRYQILNDGRNGRNKIGVFDNQEPAKYDGKEITRRCMTMQETCDRLNALEAEGDRLRGELEQTTRNWNKLYDDYEFMCAKVRELTSDNAEQENAGAELSNLAVALGKKINALEAEQYRLKELVKKAYEEGYESGMRSGTGEPFKLMHQHMMHEEWLGSEANQALKGGNCGE